MPAEYRRQYKTINIPSELDFSQDQRFQLAINEARERFTDYVMPCQWQLVKDDGENVTVCRISSKTTKKGQTK